MLKLTCLIAAAALLSAGAAPAFAHADMGQSSSADCQTHQQPGPWHWHGHAGPAAAHGHGPHHKGWHPHPYFLHEVCLYQGKAYSPGSVVSMGSQTRVCGVSSQDLSHVLHWMPMSSQSS